MQLHLDTDFLVRALGSRGPEWSKLLAIAESEAAIRMSAVAWYEFSRGPRTPDQLARVTFFLGEDGVVPFSAELATAAGDVFRALGSPRRRANDIAIGVTAELKPESQLAMEGQQGVRVDRIDHPG